MPQYQTGGRTLLITKRATVERATDSACTLARESRCARSWSGVWCLVTAGGLLLKMFVFV
eukprot:scaffold44383_cov11-Prasinocladus_malaysianus.AAC.1